MKTSGHMTPKMVFKVKMMPDGHCDKSYKKE